MQKLRFLSLVVAVLLVAGPLSADDAASTKAIIDKAIKASGGAEKLAKYKAMTWNEKGMYFGMGEGVPYTGKYSVQWPDKFRMEIEGVFTIALNGDKGYMNGEEMEKEQLEEQKENHYSGWVNTLLPLSDPSYKLTSIPETKVNNQPAVGVKVSKAGHRDVQLFFDKQTGLLVKSVAKVKAAEAGFKEVEQESFYENYKDVDGLKSPMKVVIKREGKPFVEAELLDMKRMEKLDDKVFGK